MGTTPEAKITASIIRYLKKLRKDGDPVWWLKLHGGPMQRAGVPDLLVVYYGRHFFVEVKQPGSKPTRLQNATGRKITDAGGSVNLVVSLDHFKAILDIEYINRSLS